MKTKTRTIAATACIVSALAFTAPEAFAAPSIVDPSFELHTGWTTFNGAAYSSAYAHTGTNSMADITLNNVPGSFEQFPASVGDQWTLSGFGLTPSPLLGGPFGGVSFGVLQITFFDSANNNLGTVETSPGNAALSAKIDENAPTSVWIPLTVTAHAPANTAYGQVFTLVVDFGSPAPEGVYFDDLSLVAVPEPSSLVLLGLGSFGALCAWRRRK